MPASPCRYARKSQLRKQLINTIKLLGTSQPSIIASELAPEGERKDAIVSRGTAPAADQTAGLRKNLRVLDGTAIVAGTIVGSGIFLVPAAIASQLVSPLAVLAVWLLGGVLSLFGALSIAELGTLYPGAGGLYVYLREIYGPLPAFLYGWGLLSMIHSGSIAGLAVAFGLYARHLFSLNPLTEKLISLGLIALLTAVNCVGIHFAKIVQNLSSIIKFAGLVLMIGMLVYRGHSLGIAHERISLHGITGLAVPLGVALVAVLWAFEGWHVVSFAVGEMKNPARDLPRSLISGTILVTLVYIFANCGYYAVLPAREIAHSPAIASTAIAVAYGTRASQFISLLILISVLGAMNGMVLTGPRVYYAMARDGLFFKRFARTGKISGAPFFSLCVQGIWAAGLTCSGTFVQIINYVIFTAWIFYGLTVAGVIVLRRRIPERQHAFRMPGYPFVPVVFCLAALGIVFTSIAEDPVRALLGVCLILTGVPIFMVFRGRETRPV
jgi:basic amino acid/polyamine antiporter, APA family